MTLKRAFILSLIVGLLGGLSAWILAWGLFTTHPELGMQPGGGRVIALWVTPVLFLVSLIYFLIRNRRL